MVGLGASPQHWRSRQRRWLLSGRATYEQYEQYIEQLLAAGGFWHPMRNTSGSVSDNLAYSGGTLPVTIINAGLTGNPITSWTAVAVGDGVVTPLNPGVRIQGNTTGGSSSIAQAPIFTVGKTYKIVTVVTAVSGAQGARVKIGVGTNHFLFPAGVTGALEARLVADNTHLQLTTNSGTDVSYASVSAEQVGDYGGWVQGVTSLGQTGLRGPNEAFLFDGSTSLITVFNQAALQGLEEFSLWMLFRPTSAGEGDAGTLFDKNAEYTFRFTDATRVLQMTVFYDTTNALAVTSNALSLNEWHTAGVSFSHAGDKLPHIYIDGVEASYTTTTAGEGSRVSNTNNLGVGNRIVADRTLAGLVDEALLVKRALTAQDFALLHTLATGMPPGVAA